MHRSARWLAAVLTIVLLATPIAASAGGVSGQVVDDDGHSDLGLDVRFDDERPPTDEQAQVIRDLAGRQGLVVRWDEAKGAPGTIIRYGETLTEGDPLAARDPARAAFDYLAGLFDDDRTGVLFPLTGEELYDTGDISSCYGSLGRRGTDAGIGLVGDGSVRMSHIVIGQRLNGLRVVGAGLNVTLGGDGSIGMVTGSLLSPDPVGSHELGAEKALNAAATALGLQPYDGEFVETTVPGDGSVVPGDGSVVPCDGSVVPGDGSVRTFENVFAVARLSDAPPPEDEDADRSGPLDLRAEPVWFATADGNRAAWWTEIEVDAQRWVATIVDDATGDVLQRENYYHALQPGGTVFTGQHPEDSPLGRLTVDFVGPDGDWVSGTHTVGNNVNAYQDLFNLNLGGHRPFGMFGRFEYGFQNAWVAAGAVPPDLAALNQAIVDDRDAAITQMFYYSNVVHEYLYGLGFDEPAGNFQRFNFGRGGQGSDRVLAEAHDGWGTGEELLCERDGSDVVCRNNANFGTPPDGQNPRMQMYLWDRNGVYRDGALDGDVIAHEYGHGLSSRLVGGPSERIGPGAQTAALGEGWSDAVSLFLWGDNVVGEYVTGRADRGVRSTAADLNTDRYTQYAVSRGEHRNGEVWAATLYGLAQELGIPVMEQLMVDGLKQLALSPTFVDARDGLLVADILTNAGANQCEIWDAFASRRLGLSASSTQSSVTGADDIPATCAPKIELDGPYTTNEGQAVTLTATVVGTGVTVEWDLDDDGAFDDATGTSALFTAVGQEGTYPVAARATNEGGISAIATSTVEVLNVAPIVTFAPGTPTRADEGEELTITATFRDPGWLDTHTATVDLGMGDGPQPAAITAITEQPWTDQAGAVIGVQGTVQVVVTYGDDSLPAGFEVTVEIDDGTDVGSASRSIQVDNVDPTVTIDTTDAVDVDGVPAFLLTAGDPLTLRARVTDPGSDDLTLTWDWDDGTTETVVSLVDPPNLDPLPSPDVNPRDLEDEQTHAWVDACLYTVVLTADDDDGGSGDDEVVVIALGDADQVRTAGYWHNQYRPDGGGKFFEAATLQCYLDIVGFLSGVFDEVRDASTPVAATEVLRTDGSSNPTDNLDRQLLALWLNVADGSVGLADLVDTDGKKGVDTPLDQVLQKAEATRLNPNATRKQLLDQATILDRINNRHR